MKAIYVLNSMFTDICFLIALLVNIAMSSPPEIPSKRVKNEYSQNVNTVRERNRIANMDEATRKQHNERKREREAVDRVRRRVRGADWFKALPEDKQEAKMEEEIDKFSAKR